MSMIWERWCISCSLALRIISKRVLEAGELSGQHLDLLSEEIVRQGIEPGGEEFAAGFEEGDDFRFSAGLLLFGRDDGEAGREVEARGG